MEFIDDCKKRQAELLRILSAVDQDQLWAGDELAAERFKRNAQKTISQYEKILHLLNGDQIGHA
jgi:hypothetical protein